MSGSSTRRSQATVEPRTRASLRPAFLWFSVAAVALIVATRYEHGSFGTLAAVTAAGACVLVGSSQLRRTGLLSILGLTLAVFLLTFFVNWAMGPDSAGAFQPLLTEKSWDAALLAFLTFLVAFLLAYSAVSLVLPARRGHQRRTPVTDPTRLALMSTLIFLASVSSSVLRVVLGLSQDLGRPGGAGPSGLLEGGLSYFLRIGPVALAAVLIWHGATRTVFARLGALALVAYALSGVILGWRADTVIALAAWVIARRVAGTARPGSRHDVRPAHVLLAVGALAAVVLSIQVGTDIRSRYLLDRPAGRIDASDFLSGRLSGVSFLGVVVAQVERTGTNRALVDPDRFQEYMRRDVYKQSKSDASGRAGTAVGWWYAIAGIGGTAIGGALSGIGASLLDWRLALHREGRRRVGGLFLIGAGFSWETYLLEGDARAAAVYFIVFAVVLYAAQAVSVESRDPRADGRYDRREPRGSITSRGRQPRTNPAT